MLAPRLEGSFMRARLWLGALSLAAGLVGASLAAAQPRFDFRATPGHLSKDVRPSHVRLELVLDPARDDFDGQVVITLQVDKPADAITLHARELEARSARLVHAGQARTLSVAPGAATQTWRLAAQDGAPIPAGVHRLEIAYRGVVHVRGEGLYRAESVVDGRREPMLASQLEAIHARMLFPTFDEPAFRAVFELTVQAPPGYEVLSNLPRASRVAGPDGVRHRFAPTPPMPSYLVAVAVGRFDMLEGRAGRVPLRIATAPGKREQARYALDATRDLLPFFGRYFGESFTLPRLDQLAVPGTRLGAMEDWGLISYTEEMLLVDPARTSPQTRRRVYLTVAHEIAHQWFGNLVTAASWDEIWLNEAFATWMADKAADRFNPTWRLPLLKRKPLDRAMLGDAGPATRAIRSGPVSEQRVWDVFDDITYVKGGAVLGMLEAWIGPATFQRGLAAYIAQRRLSNATAGDLWHHIGRAAGRDVGAVAASWTDRPGFPLVQVRTSCESGETRLQVRQSRFGSEADAPGTAWHAWQIPLRVAHRGRTFALLQTGAEQTHRLPGCSDAPTIVNAGGIGFYRVEYEPAQFDALRRGFAGLAPADRAALLSDTLALAQAGRVPLASYFGLLAELPRVQGPGRELLFVQAGEGLELLDAAFAGTPARTALRAAGRALLGPELARLGWDDRPGDDAETLALRGPLIEWLARFDDAAVAAEALRRFDIEERGGAPLPAAIRADVLCAVGVHADRDRFDRLLARLRRADGEEERANLAAALASGRDAGRAAELLAFLLEDARSLGKIVTVLPGLMARQSPFGELAYRHVLEHWQALAPFADGRGRARMLARIAENFNEAASATRLVEDQRRQAGDEGEALAAQAAARIRLLAAIREREAERIAALLSAWHPAG
jgi:aminopeptidase N